MRKLLLVATILMMLALTGCGLWPDSNGLYITAYEERGEIKTMRIIGRERFTFSYPLNMASTCTLFAVDDLGNPVTEGVTWSLTDETLGNLEAFQNGQPESAAVRTFVPAKVGQTIVTASNGVESDTAQIIVFPCIKIALGQGFDLSADAATDDPAMADIWWQSGNHMEFKVGYWATLLVGGYDYLDQMTGTEGIIGAPGVYIADGPIHFLVGTREGAIYGAIIDPAAGLICYRSIVSAP